MYFTQTVLLKEFDPRRRVMPQPVLYMVSSLFVYLICIDICTTQAVFDKPAECNMTNSFLKHGYVYTYKYTTTITNAFVGTHNSHSGFRLRCDVILNVPKRCEVVMQVLNCVTEKQKASKSEATYEEMEGSGDLAVLISRHAIYFQTNNGVINPSSLIISKAESVPVLNLKRGILSALSVKLQDVQADSVIPQRDIFGDCPTHYEITPERIITKRNLAQCNLPHIFLKQLNPFSAIRTLEGGVQTSPISELYYPFKSDVECIFKIGNGQRLHDISCFQQQYFKPLAHRGAILATAMSNISQVLELIDTQHLGSSNINRLMIHKKRVNLEYEFEDKSKNDDVMEFDILYNVEQLTKLYNSDDPMPLASEFQNFVSQLRKATKSAIKSTTDLLFGCEEVTSCSESEKYKQQFFLDGLLSCGTDLCVKLFVEKIVNRHVSHLQTSHFLYSLSFHPRVTENTLGTLLTYCQDFSHLSCWLPLGTMIKNTFSDSGKLEDALLQGDHVLMKMMDTIRLKIGDDCKISETVTEKGQRLAIETLGNIGFDIINKLDEEILDENDRVIPLVERCALSSAASYHVRKASIMTLKTLGFKAGVLKPSIKENLFTIASGREEDMTLRSLAFTILVEDENQETMRAIVKLQKRKDISEMLAFMSSVLISILHSSQPDLQRLRQTWETILNEEGMDSLKHKRYPVKSKHLDISNYFKLPMYTDFFGGQLVLDIIHSPGVLVAQTHTFSLSYYNGHKFSLLEISTDMKGLDDFLNAIFEGSGQSLVHLLQKYLVPNSYHHYQKQEGKEASYFHHLREDISKRILDIMDKVNFPAMLSPEVSFHIKFLDQNTAYWSLSDILDAVGISPFPTDQLKTPGYMQKLMAMLQKGLKYILLRSTSNIEILQVVPTVAGLPLSMHVSMATITSLDLNVSANAITFKEEKGPLTMTSKTESMFSSHLFCQLDIKLLDMYTGGMKLMMSGLGDFSVETTFSYASDRLIFTVTAMKSKEYIPIHIRGEMVLLHGDEQEAIAGDSQFESTADHCTGQMFEMLIGKLLCFHFVYPNVRNSERHGYFPLLGPFEMKVHMKKKDSILVNYNWILVYTSAQEKSEWTDKLAITFVAPGSVLQRNVVSVIQLNRKTLDISVTTMSPELSLSAYADFQRKYHRSQLIFSLLSANCTVQSNLLYGISLQYDAKVLSVDDNQHPKHSLIEAHFNATRPGLSLDITYSYETEGTALLDMHHTIKQTSVYYCLKDHPVMYQLHMNPDLASQNGDITKVDFVVDIDMKYVSWDPILWRNVDTFQLTYPGQNIYVENDMTANFQDANRTTTITYLSQGKQEKILMTSHVTNNSKDNRDMDFTYHMDFQHGNKYNIILDGTFIKHARDVSLNLDVTYNKGGQQTNREYTSSSVIYSGAKENLDSAMADRAMPSLWDNPKLCMTLDLYAKAVPVFGEDDKTKPIGVGAEWSFNISYPLHMGQAQYMSAGNFGKHFHSSIENFKYWFEVNEKTVIHIMTPSNAMTLPPIERALLFYFHREKGQCFDYKFKLKTSLMKISYMILYDRHPKEEEGTSQIHINLYIDSAVPFFNYNQEEIFIFQDNQFKHVLRIDHSYGYVNLDTVTDISRPNFHATQIGNMSLHLFGFNLSGDISNVYQWQHQGLPRLTLKWTYVDESTRIVVLQLRNPKLIEAIVSYCSNCGANQVWEMTLELETITPTSIQYVFKWNHENTSRLTALWLRSLVKLRLLIDHIAETIEGNLKLPLRERVIPLTGMCMTGLIWQPVSLVEEKSFETPGRTTNPLESTGKLSLIPTLYPQIYPDINKIWETSVKTISDIMKKFHLALQHDISTQQLHLKGLLQKSHPGRVFPDKQEAPSWGLSLPQEGLMKILHTMLEKIIQFDAALATYRESFPVAEILISMTRGMGKLVSSIAVNLPHCPAIKKIISECQATVVLPSPLVMNQFLDIPEVHPVFANFWALKCILPTYGAESRSSFSSSVGLVFAGPDVDANRYVYTFDGSSLRIPAGLTRKCTYLLASDLRKRKFAVLLTPQGLTTVTKTDTVTIAKSGHVFIKDCPSPLKDTYKSDDGSLLVLLEKENTKLLTNVGVVITCVTKSLEFCTIQLTDTLSSNTTVGLLGTNDGEPVTDRRLPSGNISGILSDFLQNYVISGPDICYTDTDSNLKAQSCSQGLICRDMPELPQSYWFYKQFQDVCHEYNGRCDTTSDDLCSIVVAYVIRSAMNLTYFNQDNLPALCHHFLMPSTNLTGFNSLDVVVVVNEGVSMLHASQDTGEYLWNLLGTAWSNLGARVTFVGYRAAGNNQNAHVLMVDRQGFVNHKNLALTDRSDLYANDSSSPGGFHTALQYALHLPFNIYSQRIILLVTTDEELSLKSSTYSLREELQSKQAVLYAFSHTNKWVPSSTLGIDWQGQAIQYSKITPDINTVQLPEAEIFQLVKSSQGALFNMDVSLENMQSKVTEVLDYIRKQTLDRGQEKCQGLIKN